MDTQPDEIVLNLWYVADEDGLIYSLRARAYLGSGSDADKLAMLAHFATRDYFIARVFPVPESCYIRRVTPGSDSIEVLPVAHASTVTFENCASSLFNEAIRQMEADLPQQTDLEIPESPLVWLTPIIGDDDGNLRLGQTRQNPPVGE